ncbi:MAG: hypothetical protein FGM32_08550 [Candidatus Kapabacteria bacterium]|nr:hypothetical protein [Candidatus Kapabacteria bacterium]
MKRTRIITALIMLATLAACDTEPVAPPPAPPPPAPTIEEQIAAWNPRIVVEEPSGFNASLLIITATPGDTICLGTARFRIDSANVPDSVVWSLGAGIYTTKRFSVSDIPMGLHEVQATVRKRFISATQNRDTVVERSLERTFVRLDQSASLTTGKWVPVDPTETRVDTLRVIYQDVIPGIGHQRPRNWVLGATRGCDTAGYNDRMPMAFRRYAVNFERGSVGGKCQDLYGELALRDRNYGLYQFRNHEFRIDSIYVRRAE